MTEASAPEAGGGVFFLFGSDEFRKDQAARALIEAHLEESTRDFNLDTLRGSELAVENLASVIATPPMMAEYRVVVVREVEALSSSAKARELLVKTAESPPPGLALLLLATIPAGSKAKFYTELKRRSQSSEFSQLTPDDVPGWLMERASRVHGVELEVDAAQALGSAIGENLGILAQELVKLVAFVKDPARITRADVEAVGTRLPQQDRWQWFELVGGRRFSEAASGLSILVAQGESGVGLAMGLGTHLLRIGVLLEGGPEALQKALPPHQRWLAKRLEGQARGWSHQEISAALSGLLKADQLFKASGFSDLHHLEHWLWERAALAGENVA